MSEIENIPKLKKCISYALFGYGKPQAASCFSVGSYIRGLLMSIRMNMLLFPKWEIVVHLDNATYEAYQGLFDRLPIVVDICDDEPLTKAMLWRLKPVFLYEKYSHVICRDLDSPPTYREAQCVQEWINSDKAAHAITDSISHGIPMLGGLIGFRPQYFPMMTGYDHWITMLDGIGINFDQKGADQTFLNKYIYPKFAGIAHPSIMQHYILGMPNTFLPDYKNIIPNIPVDGVSEELAASNEICSHMGQAGWLMPQAFRLMQQYQDKFKNILAVERDYPTIAYWVSDGTFD